MREAGGFRMGPFELMDLIGHDVNYAVTQSVWEAFYHDPRYTPSARQRELVAAGFLGRKSGAASTTTRPARPCRRRRPRPHGPTPARVVVHGEPGIAAPLVARIAAAGVAVDARRAESRDSAGALHVRGPGAATPGSR